jgi:hypothetical protein
VWFQSLYRTWVPSHQKYEAPVLVISRMGMWLPGRWQENWFLQTAVHVNSGNWKLLSKDKLPDTVLAWCKSACSIIILNNNDIVPELLNSYFHYCMCCVLPFSYMGHIKENIHLHGYAV